MRVSNLEFGAAEAQRPRMQPPSTIPFADFSRSCRDRFASSASAGSVSSPILRSLRWSSRMGLSARARLISLAVATLVTWRLNRALTFDRSGRRAADEAMRYAAVAAAAQAMSYGVFAVLVVTLLAATPQLAVIVGAAAGALVSYSGQALFAFRPRHPLR